ncbi:MAG TPA: ribosome silencing factor [Phycisphaerae bacterium]|jgi:ribosome-associated protein
MASTSNGLEFAIEAARIAEENKAEEVTVMDLRGLSSVTDFFVICSGTSDRQMRAVSDRITEYARTLGDAPLSVTGYESANWILLDFFDVVVHIFTSPARRYYDLELLWGDAPRIEWRRLEASAAS